MVSASAIGYYGNDRGEEILTEGSEPGDGFLADVCVEWEQATAPASDAGKRVVNIRTGVVLSGNSGILPLFKALFPPDWVVLSAMANFGSPGLQPMTSLISIPTRFSMKPTPARSTA